MDTFRLLWMGSSYVFSRYEETKAKLIEPGLDQFGKQIALHNSQ